MIEGKSVLVTGGAGFIGSHLCESLSQNNDVISLDNYSTGSVANHVEGVIYLKGDTAEISSIVTTKPDLVVHLGEYSRVEQSFDDIGLVWSANKSGTFSVLEFCRTNSSKLVYAGSSTKFGDGGLGGHNPYGWTKYRVSYQLWELVFTELCDYVFLQCLWSKRN